MPPPLARSLSALHWPVAAGRWLRRCALLGALGAAAASLLLGPMAAASSPAPLGPSPETAPPLGVVQAQPPLVMLTVGRDHTLFNEAYNDASDINGDGVLDLRFNPRITYLGLFDSRLCYTYTASATTAEGRRNDNAGLFQPAADAVADTTNPSRNLRCTNADHWSGNWLNWATTSRIDALRVVLYGGMREVDTATQTILRRAYIPQDAHSWAKEYTSTAVDGYDIRDFTPLGQPSGSGTRRHFFGNLTDVRGRNCATLSSCSNRAPLLRVIENSNLRVWEWASTERPVLHESNNHNGTRTDHTVRVEVCTASFNQGCRRYPGANPASTTDDVFKPVGLLHEFGENNAMLFGLLSGSYDRNLSGGVLRDVVSSFRDEVNPSNGTFITANARIVQTLDALRIRGFNDGRTDNTYRGGWILTRPMNEGEFVDWGNPIAEMMYEAVRYFAGRSSPTSAFVFDTSGSTDAHLGLPRATWDDPFSLTSGAARAQWCARPNLLVISNINPTFDSDQLPGSAFDSFSGDLPGLPALHVANIGQEIATLEPGVVGSRFIGQVGTQFDAAPTAKNVTSLGNIRGLAPSDPTMQGSFYSASVAHYARRTDLRPNIRGNQTVDTFAVALSAPLPQIVVPTTDGRSFSLVPFAKTIGGQIGTEVVNSTKGVFQPTNQIVDFYVERIANSCPQAAGGVASMCADYNSAINGGRYQAVFRINFETVEAGADYDMDVIVRYEISLEADGHLRVILTPEYEAAGTEQAIGYVLSGSTADGVYLVVQEENVDRPYFLNVPPGRAPGFCDVSSMPVECGRLPGLGGQFPGTTGRAASSNRTFTAAAAGTAAGFLRDPLWYAAKWGGFNDRNGNMRPDLQDEWDSNRDGTPDTYHLVQNPALLRDSLARAFNTILERSAAAGNVSANSTFITTDSAVFQATFNSANWSGDLAAFPVAAAGVGAVPLWRASAALPAHDQRRLFTTNATTNPSTVSFDWAGLSTAQRSLFGTDDTVRQQLVNYLRGDASGELRHGGTLRNRPTTVLGDIIHSSPVYVADNNTVFVGSNSGFLHAFNASTGVEQFAFAPSGLLQHMRTLADPAYDHRFFVDGEIAVSQRAQTGGRNILVGFLGRGGRGLFALDVTNPANFGASGDASRALWEATGSADPDMGFLLGRPVIARVRGSGGATTVDAVIFGNGYNSVNGSAVLYIKNLRTGALIRRIDTLVGSVASPNGLASPGLALDGNGVVQFAYAGDLQGNVWKFDLSHSNSNQWGSYHRSGSTPVPFFVAQNDQGELQPITAPITVETNTVAGDPNFGRRFLFFGTGSYMANTDPADRRVQSFYGLIDEGAQITGRAVLRQRRIDQVGTFAGRTVRTFELATAGDMAGRRGWFFDWTEPPHPPGTARGERVVSAARLLPTIVPSLAVSSIIPVVGDPCEPGGTGFLNLLDPFTGGGITVGLLDVNRDDRFTDDLLGTRFIASFDPGIGLLSEPVLVGDRLVVGGSLAQVADVRVQRPLAAGLRGRISWREIIR